MNILKPGLSTSIQDIGRYGFQKYGIITSGAMDQFAHRIANILVGNNENEPTLEITLLGPTIEFLQDSLISICGGDLSPEIGGEQIQCWRPIFVRKGSILKFGSYRHGCRAYLAVAGGLDVPIVMKSKSTYFRAKIGGLYGRALKKGDRLSFCSLSAQSTKIMALFQQKNSTKPFIEGNWFISERIIPKYSEKPTVRVLKGRQYHLFNHQSQISLFLKPFVITPQSDRMGYRLKGPSLALAQPVELISEAVCFGTIQVPADGNPIVLLADRQTIGGYPKIAQVASIDLPLLAQAKLGDSLQFTEITYSDAQRLFIQRERQIQQLKLGIKLKYQ